MTESPIQWSFEELQISLQLNGPLRNYKSDYLNSSLSDAVERNEMKKKQLLNRFWKYLQQKHSIK